MENGAPTFSVLNASLGQEKIAHVIKQFRKDIGGGENEFVTSSVSRLLVSLRQVMAEAMMTEDELLQNHHAVLFDAMVIISIDLVLVA